ncbi:hypothetical protein D3C83_266660 [compost metagenome]
MLKNIYKTEEQKNEIYNKIIEDCKQNVRSIIEKNKLKFIKLYDQLYQKETLSREEIHKIMID